MYRPDGEATMLLMPAWEAAGYIGVKMVNVFPQNAEHGIPAISGLYLLSEGKHGQPLACIDGSELTRRRTAAAFTIALAAVAVAVPLAVAAADVVAATAAVLWPPRSHFAAMEMIMAHLQLVNVLQSHFPGYCRKWQPAKQLQNL